MDRTAVGTLLTFALAGGGLVSCESGGGSPADTDAMTTATDGSSGCDGPTKTLLTDMVVDTFTTVGEASLGNQVNGNKLPTAPLAMTDTHLYWIDRSGGVAAGELLGQSGSVRRVAKTGGAVEDFFVAPADRKVVQVVTTGDEVFVLYVRVAEGIGDGIFLGRIFAGATTVDPLTSGRADGWDWDELTLDTGGSLTGSAGFHDGALWVLTFSDRDSMTSGARILRVDPATGEETLVHDATKNPPDSPETEARRWMGFSDAYVYFSTGQGELWRMDVSGSGTAERISDEVTVLQFASLIEGGVMVSGIDGVRRHDDLSPGVTFDIVGAPSIFDSQAVWDEMIPDILGFDGDRVVVTDVGAPDYFAASVALDGSGATDIACDGVGYEALQTDGENWYWIDGEPLSETRAIATAPR